MEDFDHKERKLPENRKELVTSRKEKQNSELPFFTCSPSGNMC